MHGEPDLMWSGAVGLNYNFCGFMAFSSVRGSLTRAHLSVRGLGMGWMLALAMLLATGCDRGPMRSNEVAFVAVPQAVLRDRVAPLYNKVGMLQNGEKLEVLERQKRFVKVRTASKQEGWVEMKYLIDRATFDAFDKMAKDNAQTPAQAKGGARAELNIHLDPARDSAKLYQLAESEKVDILKRATAERTTPGNAPKGSLTLGDRSKATPGSKSGKANKTAPAPEPSKTAAAKQTAPAATADAKAPEPKPMDDWWLVRDSRGHVGWVLARMIDIEVPMEIAQYAEGQRIQAAFILNRVPDQGKDVPQYLVLTTEPKDGLPFDFNAFRVFTWSMRRHRYETAYRERNIVGFLPVTVGSREFDREGSQPVFTVKLRNDDTSVRERTYRLANTMVKRVLAPGEENAKLALAREHKDKKKQAGAKRAKR